MSFNILYPVLLFLTTCQLTEGCCYYYGCYCVYSLWYFWFGLFWIVVFLILLIIGCVKKHQRHHVQVGQVAVIAGTNPRTQHQPSGMGQNKPVAPPAYGQPSHLPPPYNPQNMQSGYNPQYAGNNPPPPAYPPPAYPPPAPNYQPPPARQNDPAYPPVN